MGVTPGVIGAVAAAISAAGGLATTAYSLSQGSGSTPKMPSIPTQDTSGVAKALLPQANANTAANVGGGVAPDFIANLIGQQTGSPGAGMDIIGQIRQSLGQQGP